MKEQYAEMPIYFGLAMLKAIAGDHAGSRHTENTDQITKVTLHPFVCRRPLRPVRRRKCSRRVPPQPKHGLPDLLNVPVIDFASKLARQSPRPQGRGGKSGLRRAGCRLTAGRREAMESATENTPPMARLRRPQGRQSHLKKSRGESSCEY